MELSTREFWALIHGLVLGGGFLLAFAGGLAEFYSLRSVGVSAAEIKERTRRLAYGTTAMATVAWLTVISGTWIVYPWYREDVPTSPRSELLASPDTDDWHTFAFEWKEHLAWIAPLLATVAAAIVLYYRHDLYYRRDPKTTTARRLAEGAFVAAFVTAAVAGVLGALVTKKAPIV